MNQAERILLPLQRLQQAHDELAHRDILSFDLYKRLKHMVLHFYKYAGKVEEARIRADRDALRRTLVDALIICVASANALNLSLGQAIDTVAETDDLDSLAQALSKKYRPSNLFEDAVQQLILIGGRMAKTIESSDHMEPGNPRAEMQLLVPQLTVSVLGLLGHSEPGLLPAVRERLAAVEAKSVLNRPLS